jgi:hypothetical protein
MPAGLGHAIQYLQAFIALWDVADESRPLPRGSLAMFAPGLIEFLNL